MEIDYIDAMSNYQPNLTIKTWAEEDRPREKLIKNGKEVLSNAELIAILIGSGSRKETAVELARHILNGTNNNLHELGTMSVSNLMKYQGIGEAKAISIVAALELGRRRQSASPEEKTQIQGSKDARDLLGPKLADLPHEEFWVAYLNRNNRVLRTERIGQGGVAGTVADIRIILKNSLNQLASSIILYHNHPSGNLSPSDADLSLTRKIKQAGEYIDINVLDHLIITPESYYSFADHDQI
jgi:DNA repair protein RadC